MLITGMLMSNEVILRINPYTEVLPYIYIYILRVALYTDVTVRYVNWFGGHGHGSIRFWCNREFFFLHLT